MYYAIFLFFLLLLSNNIAFLVSVVYYLYLYCTDLNITERKNIEQIMVIRNNVTYNDHVFETSFTLQ